MRAFSHRSERACAIDVAANVIGAEPCNVNVAMNRPPVTFEIPATGPIGLEGDRGQMEYRRIRMKKE